MFSRSAKWAHSDGTVWNTVKQRRLLLVGCGGCQLEVWEADEKRRNNWAADSATLHDMRLYFREQHLQGGALGVIDAGLPLGGGYFSRRT